MKTYRVSVLMFVLSFGLIEYCTGGIVVFTDRPTWLAAAGVITGSEDFNSFTVDTSYGASSPLALSSGITLSGVGEATFQIVDAAPFFCCENVDGTAYAIMKNVPATMLLFGPAVSAFGADFAALNDNVLRTAFEFHSGTTLLATFTPAVINPPFPVRFFGFVATAGDQITEIRFVLAGVADGFGVDNIEIVHAPTCTDTDGCGYGSPGDASCTLFGSSSASSRINGAH